MKGLCILRTAATRKAGGISVALTLCVLPLGVGVSIAQTEDFLPIGYWGVWMSGEGASYVRSELDAGDGDTLLATGANFAVGGISRFVEQDYLNRVFTDATHRMTIADKRNNTNNNLIHYGSLADQWAEPWWQDGVEDCIDSILVNYGSEPGFHSYYVVDEIGLRNTAYYAGYEYICSRFDVKDPSGTHHLSMITGGIRSLILPDFTNTAPSLDIFGHDEYPFTCWNAGQDSIPYSGPLFQNKLTHLIESYRMCMDAFENTPTKWHAIIQLHMEKRRDDPDSQDWYKDHRRPTEAEIRVQAWLALTRGAKGIIGWCYGSTSYAYLNAPWVNGTFYYEGVVDTLRSKYPTYDHVKGVFTELQALRPTLVDLVWRAGFGDDTPQDFVQSSSGGDWIEFGTFDHRSDPAKYLMVVNRECAEGESRNVTVTLNADQLEGSGYSYLIQDIYSNEIYITGSGSEITFTTTLQPGEGKLFRVEAITGPNVTYRSHTVDDGIGGNNNGLVNAGESIDMSITLENIGNQTANSVSCTLSTADSCITITDSIEVYGDIAASDSVTIADGYHFEVMSGCSTHTATFHLDMGATGGHNWHSSFDVTVYEAEPQITYSPTSISETASEGDSVQVSLFIGNLGPGELWFEITDSALVADFAVGHDYRREVRYVQTDLTDELDITSRPSRPMSDIPPPQTPPSPSRDGMQTTTTFGSWAGGTWSGSLRDRGNVFHITTSTYLLEIRFYMSIASSTSMYFFVYEGSAVTGSFTRIHQSYVAESGTGEGWYSSGSINVPLREGKYYYIGTSWEGTATYGRGTEVVPLTAPFGTLETGIPGTQAGYPPASTMNQTYTGFPPYYQTLVTGEGWLSYFPVADTLSSGEQDTVIVTLRAIEADTTHQANLIIRSNDLDNSRIEIPVTLETMPNDPAIELSADAHDFGSVVVGDSLDWVLAMRNVGGAPLTVYDINWDEAVFWLSDTSGVISSGDSLEVTVRFKPVAEISYVDSLVVVSDDPDEDAVYVALSGTGDAAPAIPTGLAAVAYNDSVGLTWNANTEPDLHAYYIYRDTTSAPTVLLDSVVAQSPPDTFYVDIQVMNDTTYTYRITAVDSAGNESGYSNEVSGTASQVLANIRIFLEGPYHTADDSMTTALNSGGYMPLSSPYAEAPRTVSSIPEGVTDWILVQLRSTPDGEAVSQQSFFLKSTGDIVDTDGTTTDLIMPGVGDGDYWIVVRHRNHLAVMSATAQSLNGTSATLYDFTTGSAKYYGTGGAKELETNVWGMWSGDITQDGEVTTADYTLWYNSARAGDSGYQTTDINCDAQVTTSDYTVWYNNARAGASSEVP